MARIRSLKPEAFTSETLSSVPRETRWTFAGIWTYCDDDGRGYSNPKLIRAAVYPLDDDVSAATVADELDVLEGVGAVCRYEVDGKGYLHVPAFGVHQHPNRPTPSKLPACPKSTHGALSEDSVSAHPVDEPVVVSAHEPLTPVVVVVDIVGEVEGDVGGGVVVVRDEPRTAADLTSEWLNHCQGKPHSSVVRKVGESIASMLREGIPPPDIRAGLAEWHRKALGPTQLPAVVHETKQRAATVPRSTADERVTAAANLSKMFKMET